MLYSIALLQCLIVVGGAKCGASDQVLWWRPCALKGCGGYEWPCTPLWVFCQSPYGVFDYSVLLLVFPAHPLSRFQRLDSNLERLRHLSLGIGRTQSWGLRHQPKYHSSTTLPHTKSHENLLWTAFSVRWVGSSVFHCCLAQTPFDMGQGGARVPSTLPKSATF